MLRKPSFHTISPPFTAKWSRPTEPECLGATPPTSAAHLPLDWSSSHRPPSTGLGPPSTGTSPGGKQDLGVSQLKTGPESELVLPENRRTKVGEGWGARPGGWGAFGTIERSWAGFVSWLCLTAPFSCLPAFGMLEGRSDAFGGSCSGCTVRPRFCVSDPELAGGSTRS